MFNFNWNNQKQVECDGEKDSLDRVSFSLLISKLSMLISAAALAAMIISCTKFPEPPADDESNASFAREVIPVLLGRKPHGVDEVEVVADIAELYGRATAIEMLMKDDEFINHWSDVMLDLLRIQRERSGGIGVAQDDECWGPASLSNVDASLATWIRDHSPGEPGMPEPDWNMTDLARSAIKLDDLSSLYRANLFTMSMRRAGSNNGRRTEIANHILTTYLNRDIACLRCHNPTYSASNKTDGGGAVAWQRTWTIPGHPEKALFGNYLDAAAANSRIQFVMRGDIRQQDEDGMGIKPWGMANSCVTDTFSTTPSNNGTITHTGFKTAGSADYGTAGFGSLDGSVNPKVSLWELEQSLNQGVLDLQDGYERFTASAPLLPADEQLYCDSVAIFSANCTGCHSGPTPSGELDLSAADLGLELINAVPQSVSSTSPFRVDPNNPANSELYRRVSTANVAIRMPLGSGPLAMTEVSTIEDWINAGATTMDSASCNTSSIPDVAPDEAFAFLTASNLVDGIWLSAMGHRLTIDNGFARNRAQRDALRSLTEFTFINNNWSLREVLKKILASRWMGRRAPTISQGNTAYELPMLLDPWVEADPSLVANPPAHEKANGQGEMVNRFRVNTVLRNIAHGLSWKQPRHFPGGGYPSPLDQDIGQYLSPGQPGFDGVNFQSLLAIEDEIGLCQKSNHVEGSDDWIDTLVNAVTNFNSSNSAAPLTIGEVWSIVKDRMIQDTTIETSLPSGIASTPDAKTEQQALLDLINQGLGTSYTLNSSASELSEVNLNSKLREACGVLVKSPEFLLTNITPRGYSDNNMPDPPRMNVCMPGESCGYPALCGKWRSVLFKMGKYTACEDRSVRKTIGLIVWPLPDDLVFELVNDRYNHICPKGICGFVRTPRVNPCLMRPEMCEKMPSIPPVHPEFTDVIGKPATDLHQPGFILMNANGAQVVRTEGVRYRAVGSQQWQNLSANTNLYTGDQLYLPLTASLHLKSGMLEFGVDGLQQKSIEGVNAHLISITGDNAVSVVDRHFKKKGAISLSAMLKAEESGEFESRGIGDKDWGKIIAYAPKPGSQYTPNLDEVEKINEDFAALHNGKDRATFEKEANAEEPDGPIEPDVSDDDDQSPDDGPPWLIIFLLLIISIIAVVLFKKK